MSDGGSTAVSMRFFPFVETPPKMGVNLGLNVFFLAVPIYQEA